MARLDTMKTYITFGQIHRHEVKGKVFDKDTVGVIEAEDEGKAREIAFQHFGPEFMTTYSEKHWNEETQLHWFPKGYVNLNF